MTSSARAAPGWASTSSSATPTSTTGSGPSRWTPTTTDLTRHGGFAAGQLLRASRRRPAGTAGGAGVVVCVAGAGKDNREATYDQSGRRVGGGPHRDPRRPGGAADRLRGEADN